MAYSNSWVVSSKSATINVVTSPTAHDVLIAWAVNDSGTAATFTWPSGFTQVANILTNTTDGQSLGVAIKNDATGSEGSLAISCNQDTIIGGVIAFSGRDNTTPQDVTAVTNTATDNATPYIVSQSITPVTNGCDIVPICGWDVATSVDGAFTFSATAGTTGAFTTRQDQNDTFRNVGVGTSAQTTAGALTVQASVSGSGNSQLALVVLALKPSAGSGTNVALTGQAATASRGTLTPSADKALTGQAGTAAGGTVTPTSANALTGQAATTAAGSVAPSATVPLSGLQATGAQGSVTPDVSVALTGLSATMAQGTLTPDTSSDTNVGLTGRAATASGGTLGPTADTALSGQQATASRGTMVPGSDKGISGQSASSAQGAVTPSVAIALTGLSMTASGGTLAPQVAGNVTIQLTGLSMSMAQGALGVVAPATGPTGFWAANPYRVRRKTVEEIAEEVREEREALGIIPKRVEKVIQEVAQAAPVEVDEDAIRADLIAALKRKRQAFRDEYVRVVMLEMEIQVARREREDEEIAFALMLM